MQFKDWAISKNLTPHQSSYAEISELLKLADNNLADCDKMLKSDISADSCHRNVYEAALPSAKAVLAASGYRVAQGADGGHDLLFQALSFTVDIRGRAVQKLQVARQQRKQVTYDSVANLDKKAVGELLGLVKSLRKAAELWITKNHPALMKPPQSPTPTSAPPSSKSKPTK
jgi:uncharacterized protein (UPF0332 family)